MSDIDKDFTNEGLSDDDFNDNDQDHSKLLDAISKFDKVQHIKKPTRSEPSLKTSEFSLTNTSNEEEVHIENLVKALGQTTGDIKLGKKLKKVQNSQVLPKPLEKPVAERIKRDVTFEEVKQQLGRWDATVAKNRSTEYISYPLKTPNNKLEPADEYVKRFKLKSDLEKELEKLDPPKDEAEEDEEAETFPMTLVEMMERRKEVAKMRVLQSYQAAKANRQNKIKSKKFHRILKRQKLREQLKEFETLQMTNPEEALKKLEELEKTRVAERHTLRHKNTGKWAKSKLVRAKYDRETRKELADQLSVSRALTEKVNKKNDSSDDDLEDKVDESTMNVNDDQSNPWINEKNTTSKDFVTGYRKYWNEKNELTRKQKEFESVNLKNNDNYQVSKQEKSPDMIIDSTSLDGSEEENKVALQSTSKWKVETNDVDNLFLSLEENVKNKVSKKLSKLQKEYNKIDNQMAKQSKRKHKDSEDTLSKLEFKSNKKKQIIDEELIETSHIGTELIKNQTHNDNIKITSTKEDQNHTAVNPNIDPNIFFKCKPKYLVTALPNNENDLDDIDDIDDQDTATSRMNIEEGFEEDDVVASFRQEKQDEINKSKPLDIDLSLPGWGEWGGKNIKRSKKKRKRFIISAPKQDVRRDDNKGDIIIREFKDAKIRQHKVGELPFPFNTVKDFEASIRAPIGNTFVPETAHHKLIQPNVVTKAGTIIEPMDEDDLFLPRRKILPKNNKSVIPLN